MDLDAIQAHNEEQANSAEERAKIEDTAFALSKILDSQKDIEDSVRESILNLVKFIGKNQPEVSVINQQPFPKFDEVVSAVKAVVEAVKDSKTTLEAVEQKEADYTPIVSKLEKLAEAISKLPKPVDKVSVTNQTDYSGKFDEVTKAVQGIDIPAPIVNVEKPVIPDNSKELESILKAVEKIKFPDIPKTDLKPLIEATQKVNKTIANLSFPVPNYVLPFKDADGKSVQALVGSDGIAVTVTTIDDTLFTNESYVTTNSYSNARPTNGDFITSNLGKKELVVQNSGANSATLDIRASIDSGVNYDVVLGTDTVLATGNLLIIEETRAFTRIQIKAKSTTSGQSTTVQTRGYALGGG